VLATLNPFFERIRAAEGVYDFLVVCDDRNNTPDTIDENELIIDIYLKPVRAAEFILVNFYATRTSANFEELVARA
jgi:phage tail sheath protein FI